MFNTALFTFSINSPNTKNCTIKKWTDRWNYFVVGTLSSWSPDNITWWRTWRRVFIDSGPSLYKNKSYCLPRGWERSDYWYFYFFVLDFEAYPFRLSQTFYSIAVFYYQKHLMLFASVLFLKGTTWICCLAIKTLLV